MKRVSACSISRHLHKLHRSPFPKGRDEDGCYGGHMADVYKFIAKFGQLASSEDASYTHSVGTCSYKSISNSLTGAYIDGKRQILFNDEEISTSFKILHDCNIKNSVIICRRKLWLFGNFFH